jgi:hypothetical protein
MSVIPILLSRQIAKAHAPMLRRNVCKDSFSQARRALTRPGELKTPRNSLWFAELAEALNIRISKQCLHHPLPSEEFPRQTAVSRRISAQAENDFAMHKTPDQLLINVPPRSSRTEEIRSSFAVLER